MSHVPGLEVNFAYSDRCQTFARCCHMVPTAFPSARGPAAVSIRAAWFRMQLSFQMYPNVSDGRCSKIILGVLADGGSRRNFVCIC